MTMLLSLRYRNITNFKKFISDAHHEINKKIIIKNFSTIMYFLQRSPQRGEA